MAWCDVVEPRTLRECRIALGQSQSSFAAMLWVSPESYRTWDAGRRATPPKILARARALATHRDEQALLPLPVLALLIGVHVKTLRAAARCLGAQLAISVNNCHPPRDPRSRMTSFKRTQRKYVQKAYRVRNWREYETGLRARGSLTVWLGLTDGKLANWNSPRPTRRKPGRQRKYSNHAIETTVKDLGLGVWPGVQAD